MGKGRWDKPGHPNDQIRGFPLDGAASGPRLAASLSPLPAPPGTEASLPKCLLCRIKVVVFPVRDIAVVLSLIWFSKCSTFFRG